MKINKPVVYSFVCSICQQGQSVHYSNGEYSVYDKHCEYSIKFTEPKLVRLPVLITSQRVKGNYWQCPACDNPFRLEEINGGFIVRDVNCGIEMLISSGSPLLC